MYYSAKIVFQRIFFMKGTLLFAFGEKISLIGKKKRNKAFCGYYLSVV